MRIDGIWRRGLYRSRRGILFGVCSGLAETFELSVFWTRTIVVVMLVFSGFWPVGLLYLVAALLMKPEPVVTIGTEDEQEFYDSYVHSRRRAVDRLKRRYDSLERRIRRMEHRVTAREFEWEERFHGS